MEKDETQTRRIGNQRRIALELIRALPDMLQQKRNFPRLLSQYFQQNGRFGSRDRRLYRELAYTYLRFQPWLDSSSQNSEKLLDATITLATPIPEVLPLLSAISGTTRFTSSPSERYRRIGISDETLAELAPAWFKSHCSRQMVPSDWRTLLSRPPLWLRRQKGDPEKIVRKLGEELKGDVAPPNFHETIPDAICCPPDFPIQTKEPYLDGCVEIQDISSQALLHFVQPQPKGDWLDACAGAGGKSLQLARILGPAGRVFAYDPRAKALEELVQRAKRSGMHNISALRKPPATQLFAGVLVDAPCSGTGTWRRHPYLMRQTAESDIFAMAQTQSALLEEYADRVAPGGTLVYCTCSLSRHENEKVAARFLANRGDFRYQPLAQRFGLAENGLGISVYPADFNGDGLYVVSFQRQ